MIHIALCTESLEDFSSFAHGIERYRAKHKRLEFGIQKLSSKKILKALHHGSPISIFFLDNDSLPDHGLVLAKEILNHVADPIIIFMCSTKELAFDAFSLFAQRYLLFPLKQKYLFEALDHALSYVTTIQKKHFGMKTSKGLIKIAYDQLSYIESRDRVFFAHCKNGRTYRSVALRKSFEDTLESLLSDSRFIQTHKSFIVNMSQIRTIEPSDVIMQNGTMIPIAQSRYGYVRKEYRAYLGINDTEEE